MPRLTLSKQVSQLTADKEELTAALVVRDQTIAAHLAANESMQKEVIRLNQLVAAGENNKIRIEELEKKLKDAESMRAYNNTRADKAENELEQAHAVLDSVDGAPPREYDVEYGRGQRNVVTRLAGAFLAIARKGN